MIEDKVFGCLALRPGCVLIGVFTILLQAVPFLIVYIFLFKAVKNANSVVVLTIGVSCFTVLLIASLDLFIGVKTSRRHFLIPWLVTEPVTWLLMPVPVFYLSKYVVSTYFSGPFDFTSFVAAIFIPLSWVFLAFFINVFIYFYGFVWTLYKILKAQAMQPNSPRVVSRA